MPIGGNPYFYNPQVGQIAGNLATAIFGDPETRMKRDYYGSAVEENQAQAGKYRAETTGIDLKNNATRGLGTSLGSLFAPGADPVAVLRGNPQALADVLTAGGGNADQQTSALGNLFSQALAQGTDGQQRSSLIIQGHQPTEDFAGSEARADSILKTKGDQKYRTETGVANIKAGADLGVARINQGGQNQRFFGAPIEAKQGGTVFLAPTDPRYGKVGDKNGVIKGNPNEQTIRGQAGARMLAGDKDQSLPGLFNGSGGVPKAGAKPVMVGGRTINEIIVGALQDIPGAVAETSTALKPQLDPAFEGSIDPTKLQAAKDAAIQVMQQTGNQAQAGQAFRDALGLQQGTRFGKERGVFNLGGIFQSPHIIAPPAPQAPATPAPPAPAISSPAQLPPPEQRSVGMVINSPRGPVQWTGQGWVPAPPVN